MAEKKVITIDKSKTKTFLKTFLGSLIIATLILLAVSLYGEIKTDSTEHIVYLETILSDMPYFGLKKTYDYGTIVEPLYYNRDISFELSAKVENIFLYKLTNFYLPFIFLKNIISLIGLTLIIMSIRYLVKMIRNKFVIKFK